MEIKLKRAYDPTEPSDGTRILVDRLWPRGVTKEALHLDLWVKEVAPSDSLRTWFAHDPKKWNEFQKRYFKELSAHEDALGPIRKALKGRIVTFVFGAKDVEHNNAVCLRAFLLKPQGVEHHRK
jgi:uncharacterized protein YeaO (DUF488 family)